MFRQFRSIAIVALAVSALAVTTRPAHAEAESGSVRQSVANYTSPDFLVNGVTLNAQDQSSNGNPRHEGIGIGVKGGFLWPSFAEAQGAGFEDNTGWMLGIFFGGNRPGTIGVMGELQYGKRGASFGTVNLDQYFLEIPILARINAGSNSLNGILFYGMVGPVFDILLNTKLNGVDVKDKYQSLDVGVLIAGGVEITRFLVEARFNKGLKNVLKSTGGGVTDIKQKSFALEFGVRFN